jgi:hypothetical protein
MVIREWGGWGGLGGGPLMGMLLLFDGMNEFWSSVVREVSEINNDVSYVSK